MKKFFQRMLCLVLSIVLTVSVLSSVCAYALQGADSEYSVDFSNAQSEYNLTVPPSEILKMLYPDANDTAELEYLDAYFQHTLIYSPEISGANVTTSVNGTKIEVTATEKKYTASNGETVTWYPVCVSYGQGEGKPMTKSLSGYECELELGEATVVSVRYECSITLPDEYVSELSSFARNEALLGAQYASESNTAMQEYISALKKYEKYISDLALYENSVVEYEEYLEKTKIYEKSFAEYNAYLSSLAQYKVKKAAYDKYIADYQVYVAAKNEYEEAYEKNQAEYDLYKKYLENLGRIRTSTAHIESLFITPTNGVGKLYNALQNKELVSMIEKYEDELVNFYGVKREDVDIMRSSADELNALLQEYSRARDISEEHAFAYYKSHYRAITEKFNFLYDKMCAIITPTIYLHMCALIETEYKSDPQLGTYKKWRIRNVLCHIYLICRGLDDTVTADDKWSFYLENGNENEYNFSDLLSQNIILTDTNSACPDKIEWWSGDIPASSLPKPPVAPAEVTEPVMPIPVAEPIKPTTVSAPGEKPEQVAPPGVRPVTEGYELILRTGTYFGDTIPPARALTEQRELRLSTYVQRAFSADGSPTVSYYSYDGELLSSSDTPDDPTRQSTPEYTYTFVKWEPTHSGADTLYYPSYSKQKRTYTAAFLLADGTVLSEKEYEYGAIPNYDRDAPQKSSTNEYTYEFCGWYPSISPITDNVEYIAQFSEQTRFYTVSWSILGSAQQHSLPYGASISMPTVRQTSYIDGVCYEFLGWDTEKATVTEDIAFTAQFKKTPLVVISEQSGDMPAIYDTGSSLVVTLNTRDADVSGLLQYAAKLDRGIAITTPYFTLRLDIQAVRSLSEHMTKTFSVLSSENGVGFAFEDLFGSPVLFSGNAQLSISHSFTDGVTVFVYKNGIMTVPCSQDNGSADFTAAPLTYYKVSYYRSLTVKDAENGAVFADKELYRVGEVVTFKMLPNSEYIISKITLTDKNGVVTDITGMSSFAMPDADITLSVEFSQKRYAITFICDGEIIETQYYLLGEAITPPKIPASYEKDGFLYSFIGWSEPLSIATSDLTVTAKYTSVKITEAQTAEIPSAMDTVLKTQVLPAVVIILLSAAGITTSIIILKKQKSKRRSKNDE